MADEAGTPYQLGVDLGTTFTTTAVTRDAKTGILRLSSHSTSVPTVVALTEGGELVAGHSAETAAADEPGRIAREIKRRLRDPAPVVMHDVAFDPADVAASLIAHVVAETSTLMGGDPAAIVLTYPSSNTPAQVELMARAARAAGVGSPTLLAEAEAA